MHSDYDYQINTYFETNKVINRRCIAILPPEPKRKLQKCKVGFPLPCVLVAIGDGNVLQYWEYKKGEMVQSYKSPEPFPNEISRVIVSG